MSVRDKLNNNPAISASAAVLLLVICLGVVAFQFFGGGRRTEDAYFYVPATDTTFTAKSTRQPVKAPHAANGGESATGYRASIYACGECGNYTDMTRAEIEKTGAELVYLVKQAPSEEQADSPEPIVMSKPDKLNWVNSMSSAAGRVTEVGLACEDPSALTPCAPGDSK